MDLISFLWIICLAGALAEGTTPAPITVTGTIPQDAVTYTIFYKPKGQPDSAYLPMSSEGDLKKCIRIYDSDHSHFEWKCMAKVDLSHDEFDMKLEPIQSDQFLVNIYKGKQKKGNPDVDFIYVRDEEWNYGWHEGRRKIGPVWSMLPPDTPEFICPMKLAWERWQQALQKKNGKKCSKRMLQNKGYKCNFDHEYTANVARNKTLPSLKFEYQRREGYCSSEMGVCGATKQVYVKHAKTKAGNWYHYYKTRNRKGFKPTGCFVWKTQSYVQYGD